MKNNNAVVWMSFCIAAISVIVGCAYIKSSSDDLGFAVWVIGVLISFAMLLFTGPYARRGFYVGLAVYIVLNLISGSVYSDAEFGGLALFVTLVFLLPLLEIGALAGAFIGIYKNRKTSSV